MERLVLKKGDLLVLNNSRVLPARLDDKLTEEIRESIKENNFSEYKKDFISKYKGF